MFGKRFTLFKLLGFSVRIDVSWIIIALLVTWSLASGVFPYYYEGLSTGTYWFMGVLGALGLFASIIAHEFTHSLVARRFGMPMEGITLFIFGGVAEMEDEPPSAKAEFAMAIAGPISSIIIGFIFWGFYAFGATAGWGDQATGVFGYLRMINWVLAGFNLLPAFPLDGGRVLRSIIWNYNNNLNKATRIASRGGSWFGAFLIVAGVFFIVSGAFISGLWWILIGMFLRNASQMSYRRLIMRQALEGESIERFMNREPITVPPDTTVEDLVEKYVYKFHYRMYPVSNNHKLMSCVSTREIKEIPREQWATKKVSDIATQCNRDNVVRADDDPVKALSLMNKTGNSRLLVVDEDNNLAGILTAKDLIGFLSLKFDLEEESIKKI